METQARNFSNQRFALGFELQSAISRYRTPAEADRLGQAIGRVEPYGGKPSIPAIGLRAMFAGPLCAPGRRFPHRGHKSGDSRIVRSDLFQLQLHRLKLT